MDDLPESLAHCSPTPAQVLLTRADVHSKSLNPKTLLHLAAIYGPEVAETLQTCLTWLPRVFFMPQGRRGWKHYAFGLSVHP